MESYPTPTPPPNTVTWQDTIGVATIAVPLILAIGFFFTLKAKAGESEKEIKALATDMEKSISRLNELLLLKLDARISIITERFDVLKNEQVEQKNAIDNLTKAIGRQKESVHEILKQLSCMGIDLYVIGEKDRRSHPRND